MKISPRTTGRIAWPLVSAIGHSLRIIQDGDDSNFWENDKPFIYALWHGRMFLPMFCRRNRGIRVLVSEHRDGEIITATLGQAGYDTVRGSTTRGGARALAEVIRRARSGDRLAFTPDGPRGPRYVLQSGVIYAALKSAVPIIPLTGSARKAYYFHSWDGFQLPLPFSKAVFCVGEPYYVDGDTAPENIEHHRRTFEKKMLELTQRADELARADVPS